MGDGGGMEFTKYWYNSSEISWDWSTSLRTLTQASVNVREPRRAKSRMDNPEKLGTVGTQDTGRRQTKQQQQQNPTNN